MSLLPKDVLLNWFRNSENTKKVTELHHANTVLTSLSFAKLGGLVSRARVVAEKLPQTEQYTDEDDKRYGSFDKLFLDPTDLHQRLSGRNHYGPVTFVFDVAVLELPCVREVSITRYNPANWHMTSIPKSNRWLTPKDIAERFDPQGWQNHIVLKCATDLLPFTPYLRRVLLADPEAKLPDKTDAFQPAFEVLTAAFGRLGIAVRKRECQEKCGCRGTYDNLWRDFRVV